MKTLKLAMILLAASLAACPGPMQLLSDEELEQAAASGNPDARRELAERRAIEALPSLPDNPMDESAYREVRASGDTDMMQRLEGMGNPWARWHAAEEIFLFGGPDADYETARNYMIAADNGGVLEAQAFLILAHDRGLYGYPRDPDYVREHLYPLRIKLAEEIENGNTGLIDVIKGLPDVPHEDRPQ